MRSRGWEGETGGNWQPEYSLETPATYRQAAVSTRWGLTDVTPIASQTPTYSPNKKLVVSKIWPNCLGLDSSTLLCGRTGRALSPALVKGQ